MPAKGSGITTLAKLRARCSRSNPKDPDCCWLWKGAIRQGGGAAIHIHDPALGRDVIVSAPRAVAILKGKEIPRPGKSWTICGNPHCCNPLHERTGTYAEWGAWIRESKAWVGNLRRLGANAALGRRRSKINLAIARQMRASPLTQKQEAQRWSELLGRPISHDVVHDVRTGRRWLEPNPFAGLGA